MTMSSLRTAALLAARDGRLPMVIIGAGHVAGRAAQALRAEGWLGVIHLIGEEPLPPYERPALSKSVLTGEQTLERCLLRSPEQWAADGVLWQSARVQALYPVARQLVLSTGENVHYEAVLLATGGRARHLSMPGHDLPGVFTLRTALDAQQLAPRLRPGQRVLVVGGGFIGLEVAASARQRGCEVSVVEAGPRLLGRAVPAVLVPAVAQLHSSHGVSLRTGCGLERVAASAQGALSVSLSDGSTLEVDTVVVGIGIQPNTELAQAAGLAVRQGVVVNACLAASAPGVFAAGDVAEFPSVLSGQPMRQETWHNAETQARTAALGMLGRPEPYAALPWFWSDQFDHQLQVSGEPALASASSVRWLGEPGASAQIHWFADAGGRLVGACGFGPSSELAREMKLARTLVERASHATLASLSDPATKLKALLR